MTEKWRREENRNRYLVKKEGPAGSYVYNKTKLEVDKFKVIRREKMSKEWKKKLKKLVA